MPHPQHDKTSCLPATNIITDFEDGTDFLVLPDGDFPLQPNGLSFEDLTVTQTEDGTTISLNNERSNGISHRCQCYQHHRRRFPAGF
jgi:hypothetical protein